MHLIDRYIVRSFLINYVLAFVVMVGMWTLLDLIINFDQFADTGGAAAGGWEGMQRLLTDIGVYYGYQMMVIFQQVCGIIPLLAAGFTMWRMTRHHELTALMASGVSLYRVAVPVVFCAIFFTLLLLVDQEVLMPNNVDKLLLRRDEISKPVIQTAPIYFVRDQDGSLVLASKYDAAKQTMYDVRIIKRQKDGTPIGRILVDKAVWSDRPSESPYGGWVMDNARQINDRSEQDPTMRSVETVSRIIYQTGLTPKQLELVFEKKAADFLSTAQIRDLISNSPEATRPDLQKTMLIRFTQPLMNLVLLLIGIPFLLTREPGELIVNMLYCIVVTGFCFITTFVMFQMAGGPLLAPVWGAWLPFLLFAPLAAVMMGSIKT